MERFQARHFKDEEKGFINLNQFQNDPDDSRRFKNVLKCSIIFQNVPEYSRVFPWGFRMFQKVL